MPRKKGCTHSRNPKTGKCRSKVEHERGLKKFRKSFSKGKVSAAVRKIPCKHSLDPKTQRCRTRSEHEDAVRRFRERYSKGKLVSLAKKRAADRALEPLIYGDDGYVPFV